jgi:hypothetical protein
VDDFIAAARRNIGAITKLSGGLALLVAVALVATDANLKDGRNAAATATFGGATLTISAASDAVTPGTATTITWSATGVTDLPSSVSCFGSGGTNCGTPFQTITPSSYSPYALVPFTADNKQFLLMGNGNSVSTHPQASMQVFQWMPPGTPSSNTTGCFGTGAACGGTGIQTFTSYSNRFAESFAVGSALYFAMFQQGPDSSQPLGAVTVYKWMSAGTPSSNTKGCIGNGTTCGTALNSTGNIVALSYMDVFSINGEFYMGAVINSQNAGNNTLVYKWITSKECFGDGTTCNNTLQTMTSRYPAGINAFAAGSNSYLLVSSFVTTTGNTSGCNNKAQIGYCLYKWMPPNTPTASANPKGCFGNGTTCGTTIWEYSGAGTVSSAIKTTSNDVIFSEPITGTNYVYKWMPPGTPSSNTTGCIGSATACGSTLTNFSSNYPAVWSSLVVGSNTYIAASIQLTIYVYRWMPAGTPSSNTTGCLGNGTTCGSAVWSYKPSGVYQGPTSAFFAIGTIPYMGIVYPNTSQSGALLIFKSVTSGSTPACSVTWTNAGGSGTLATANSGSQTTGNLTQNTTYTLACAGVGSVPITVYAASAPTASISAPTSVVYGNSVTVSATYSAAANDTLTQTAINGPAPSPVPSGYNWTLAPGLSWTPPANKTFVFNPQTLGVSAEASYTFIPDASSQAYPGWNHSNNQSVTISVTCPAGYGGSTCSQCAAGYSFNSSSQCVPDACTNNGEFPGIQPSVPSGCSRSADGVSCTLPSGGAYNASTNSCSLSLPTIASFNASRVRPGAASTLSWNIADMSADTTCTVSPVPASGTQGGDITFKWDGSSNPFTGTATTPAITTATKYTLTCTSGGVPFSRDAVVNLVPVYQEL